MQTITRYYHLLGHSFEICDFAESYASDIVFQELENDAYRIFSIEFQPGDIVVDIGAHVGIFSICLARLHPEIRIFAFEPVLDNYRHFEMNLQKNGIVNVSPFNFAITADAREITLIMNPINSGGALQLELIQERPFPDHQFYRSHSMTLDAFFKQEDIQQCKLLKIDCEGAEYDILNQTKVLEQVQYLVGELHINQKLSDMGHSPERLIQSCLKYIPYDQMFFHICQMAE